LLVIESPRFVAKVNHIVGPAHQFLHTLESGHPVTHNSIVRPEPVLGLAEGRIRVPTMTTVRRGRYRIALRSG